MRISGISGRRAQLPGIIYIHIYDDDEDDDDEDDDNSNNNNLRELGRATANPGDAHVKVGSERESA